MVNAYNLDAFCNHGLVHHIHWNTGIYQRHIFYIRLMANVMCSALEKPMVHMCYSHFGNGVCNSRWDRVDYHKVSSFPKAEWWVAELFFWSFNNWGWNFLQNECSQFSQIYLSPEKLTKMFTFNLANFWMLKLAKTSTLPNYQVPNSFFLV